MSRRTKILIALASTVAALALIVFGVWWFLLRSDAPAPVSLDEAVESLSTTTTVPVATSDSASESTTTTVPGGLSGTWVVDTGSFAGYRVEEELANVGFTTAAGRSDQVTGSLVITKDSVTAVAIVIMVEVTVDVTALESDSDRRDRAIETQALETRDFPNATFMLSEAIALPVDADTGTAFTIPATGDLTIHGVTNRVTIDLEARFVDGRIVVVGSTPVLFSDYGIDPPVAMVLLSVEDNGVMEFQLILTRG